MLSQVAPPTSVAEIRDNIAKYTPILNANPPEVGALHEQVLLYEVDGVPATVDVAVPAQPGPHPVLIYLHGGCWVGGSARSHRRVGLRFAEEGFVVANLDYRLAPEAPFPAAFEDTVEAVRWAAREAQEYGGDPSRIVLGGDSAGANLAAAAAVALNDDPSAPRIDAMILLYGVYDFAMVGREPGGEGKVPMFTPEATRMVFDAYFGPAWDEALLADPRLSPIHRAGALPPSYITVGSEDPLAWHSTALAAELERNGVPHELTVFDGMPHGFVRMHFLPDAEVAVRQAVDFVGAHVGLEPAQSVGRRIA